MYIACNFEETLKELCFYWFIDLLENLLFTFHWRPFSLAEKKCFYCVLYRFLFNSLSSNRHFIECFPVSGHIVLKIALLRTDGPKICGSIYDWIRAKITQFDWLKNSAADFLIRLVHYNAIFQTMCWWKQQIYMWKAEKWDGKSFRDICGYFCN